VEGLGKDTESGGIVAERDAEPRPIASLLDLNFCDFFSKFLLVS
jgi:hypothetical protein